ncbi:TlpA disulfide reductase family protein [Flavitalea sp. BT771]|uniref:TlpA disulfide reductase family protein n=1 Tax=Flavitalea sp. BT771 TaxID=3063329 RepID=UPI0026E48577|nr:TlpA disulfide reductase family protein [Flavitalea sp. BT771]MDO6433881.1 TlpA disulfide reductase family protein [Flavitalea sp. BT771]MDV6222214.1 TlpA disulfide reductase family protein [Flavitalea sp. BT771]
MSRSFFFLLISQLAGPVSQAQNAKYSITGRIEGLKEHEKVTMMLSNSKGLGSYTDFWVVSDTASVKNGEFYLSGTVPEGPRRYMMIFDKHDGKKINLYLNNYESITINSSNIDQIPSPTLERYISIKGSPTNYSLLCLVPAEEIYYESIGKLNRYVQKLKDSIGFDGPMLGNIFTLREELNKTFYYQIFYGDKDPDDSRTPDIKESNIVLPTYYSSFQRSGHAAYWAEFYKNLDSAKKNSFLGKWMKELTALCIGQPFPAFSFSNAEGRQVTSNELLGRNKMTLIHFWATHSYERRKFQYELRDLYKQYHDKGLDVVGISSDIDMESWKEALTMEKYPWLNLINPGGKIIEKVYREYGNYRSENTTNVLLDRSGNIVAWDVNGAELEWNLWKYLGDGKSSTQSVTSVNR